MVELVRALIDAGQYDAAMQFAESIGDQDTRCSALFNIVSHIVKWPSERRKRTANEMEQLREQAAPFMERLRQERGGGQRSAYSKSMALAFMGHPDEAYHIAKNEGRRSSFLQILCNISEERYVNGHFEEAEKWYQKCREEFYSDGETPDMKHTHAFGYIALCTTLGKYEEALDLSQQAEKGRLRYDLETIAALNVETFYRHNSETLVARMLELAYHPETNLRQRETLIDIVKAQIQLGQFEASLQTLSRMGTCPKAFAEILIDLAERESPEKIAKYESAMLELMNKSEDSLRDLKIAEGYARAAALLLERGKPEDGRQYWGKIVDSLVSSGDIIKGSENLAFYLEQAMAVLIESGQIEPVLEVLHYFDTQYPLPRVWLLTAEKQVENQQRDAADESLKKGIAALDRIDNMAPIMLEVYAQASTIAATLGDKESFDTIVSSGMAYMEGNEWHHRFSDLSKTVLLAFTRSAAVLKDKDNPIFQEAETILAGYYSVFDRSELLCSLAVSRAMLGMHEESLRLLKKGRDELLKDRITLFGNLMESIIEAKSYARIGTE